MPLFSECSKNGFKYLNPTWHEILQRRCRGLCAPQYAMGVLDVLRDMGSKYLYDYEFYMKMMVRHLFCIWLSFVVYM